MKRILMMAALAICTGFPNPAAGSVTHYAFPANIALELKQLDETHIEATVEPRIGSPVQVKLFFESSEDLSVSPATSAIEILDASRPEKFRLSFGRTGRPADASGSWIRLRAVYRPDYKQLERALGDARKYPDESERQRLIDIMIRNRNSGAVQTDATRLDLGLKTGTNR
ncbi:MAG TPA: hypothetical protein PLP29_14610 [Candidatus Ozemobacteraceae bacterium]|nr:hypothetical protein [Candidatus Ozemobacteraceae bacterium]